MKKKFIAPTVEVVEIEESICVESGTLCLEDESCLTDL